MESDLYRPVPTSYIYTLKSRLWSGFRLVAESEIACGGGGGGRSGRWIFTIRRQIRANIFQIR